MWGAHPTKRNHVGWKVPYRHVRSVCGAQSTIRNRPSVGGVFNRFLRCGPLHGPSVEMTIADGTIFEQKGAMIHQLVFNGR